MWYLPRLGSQQGLLTKLASVQLLRLLHLLKDLDGVWPIYRLLIDPELLGDVAGTLVNKHVSCAWGASPSLYRKKKKKQMELSWTLRIGVR
jgi:hypothetical protein